MTVENSAFNWNFAKQSLAKTCAQQNYAQIKLTFIISVDFEKEYKQKGKKGRLSFVVVTVEWFKSNEFHYRNFAYTWLILSNGDAMALK